MSIFTSAFSILTKRTSSAIVLTKPSIGSRLFHSSPLTMKASPGQASVVLVGCGAPDRGMGWYHGLQLIQNQCPSASLDYVVEPWFLGPGRDGPGSEEFVHCQAEWEFMHDIQFLSSMEELPDDNETPRLTLISGRTADNPSILTQAIKSGSKCIYLEKPGAPTVRELQIMKNQADEANVPVLMGYNKNVCKYVRLTREYAKSIPGSTVTFVSNNAYENTAESLGECFERNAEGMLKNMVIHELALLVSFYDVTVDSIQSVVVDTNFSSLQTLKGPDGNDYTDFDKIKFTITTKNGTTVSVAADRCGGSDSYAMIQSKHGKELMRYTMPDEDDLKNVDMLKAKYPRAMPYFFTQDADYRVVKERVAKHTVDGQGAEGIATIDVAIKTLMVAEYLTPILQEQLK